MKRFVVAWMFVVAVSSLAFPQSPISQKKAVALAKVQVGKLGFTLTHFRYVASPSVWSVDSLLHNQFYTNHRLQNFKEARTTVEGKTFWRVTAYGTGTEEAMIDMLIDVGSGKILYSKVAG